MNVIFLDIDGVLITTNNSSNSLADNYYLNGFANGFDETAADNLNRLIEKTGARIVISSSIRLSNSIAQLKAILESGGIKNPPVIDVTPFVADVRTHRSHRGKEILAWLLKNPGVDNYIVIDDCDRQQLSGIPANRIVKTTYRDGFGDNTAYRRAVEMLARKDVA